MGTYERKVNQLKDLMRRKYKSAYNKSKEMDIDISSMTYLPCPDAFNVINIEKMHVILDRVNKIIDENKLHDATYDIELTRDIFYRIISKLDERL